MYDLLCSLGGLRRTRVVSETTPRPLEVDVGADLSGLVSGVEAGEGGTRWTGVVGALTTTWGRPGCELLLCLMERERETEREKGRERERKRERGRQTEIEIEREERQREERETQ